MAEGLQCLVSDFDMDSAPFSISSARARSAVGAGTPQGGARL